MVAGVGAIAFTLAITWATHLFLGGLVGYQPPNPQGEGGGGNLAPLLNFGQHPFFLLLPLVVGLGGMLSGLIVFTFAPEAEGHGTDAAIAAFHYEEGRVRARIPLIKLVASAITIGSGGSGGREGPTAQISAGFGSLLARWLGLSAADRRIALAAGMGAGIGAIFRAPLGGALIGAEILYTQDIEIEAIVPSLIASIIGYAIYGAWAGWAPIFGNQAQNTFNSPLQLIYYALLGIICGGIGILYARTFHGTATLFHRLPLSRHWLWVKPTIGGVLVGLMGLLIPEALGMGYGWVQAGMGPLLLTLPLWLVLALPFAKILSTCAEHWLRGQWRHLWPWDGHWQHGRRRRLALSLPASASDSRYPRAVCHCCHDGALWRDCARAARGDADGGRDDRQPLAAGSSDGRRGAWPPLSWGSTVSIPVSWRPAPILLHTGCA